MEDASLNKDSVPLVWSARKSIRFIVQKWFDRSMFAAYRILLSEAESSPVASVKRYMISKHLVARYEE
jgi:hypothetical protein